MQVITFHKLVELKLKWHYLPWQLEPCAIAASQASKESGKKDEKKQPQRKGILKLNFPLLR